MKKSNKRQGGARNGRQALRKSREKQFGSRQGGKRKFEEVTGKVHMSRDGFVFVVPEGDVKDNDVFVKANASLQRKNNQRPLLSKARENLHPEGMAVVAAKVRS